MYSGGGVGVFGEVGVPEAAMREKKWTRIVITLGNAPAVVAPTRAVPTYEEGDEDDEGQSYSRMNFNSFRSR